MAGLKSHALAALRNAKKEASGALRLRAAAFRRGTAFRFCGRFRKWTAGAQSRRLRMANA
ncbi:MAG TPA: hypothetical protein IAA75_05505 [Candidatus Pullichristensenella avicola]|nr:hypothetical protein [Candidatus Pullichristensenella avicola]